MNFTLNASHTVEILASLLGSVCLTVVEQVMVWCLTNVIFWMNLI